MTSPLASDESGTSHNFSYFEPGRICQLLLRLPTWEWVLFPHRPSLKEGRDTLVISKQMALTYIFRVNMCGLATEESSNWLMVDSWEAFQTYQRTAVVLDHFNYEINTVLGGVETQDGGRQEVRVMLLAGSDLIATMGEPGVWAYKDVCVPFNLNVCVLTSDQVGTYSRGIWDFHCGARRGCKYGSGYG